MEESAIKDLRKQIKTQIEIVKRSKLDFDNEKSNTRKLVIS